MKRPWLLPLVPLYGAGLWMKRRFEGEPNRLQWPVVSVGSLSAGGAGKTPVVLALAELLGRAGYGVDVLSRGYGRMSKAVGLVDPAGTAEAFGDEPLLLARAGLRVWVGTDRFAAGSLAEEPMSQNGDMGHPIPHVHLLDDGLQHRRLARALDVVLLTASDVEDCLLPAGNLREPLGRLCAAGAVVLREEEAERLRPVVRRLAGEVPVWVVQRRMAVEGASKKPLAFCGIARPEGFVQMLTASGVDWAGGIRFADHHRYNEADSRWLLREAKRLHADGFVTTEKDAVKMDTAMRTLLERVGSVAVAQLTASFLDEVTVLRQIVARELGTGDRGA